MSTTKNMKFFRNGKALRRFATIRVETGEVAPVVIFPVGSLAKALDRKGTSASAEVKLFSPPTVQWFQHRGKELRVVHARSVSSSSPKYGREMNVTEVPTRKGRPQKSRRPRRDVSVTEGAFGELLAEALTKAGYGVKK